MLAVLLSWFVVHLLLDLDLWFILSLTSEQSTHSMLAILLVNIWVGSSLNQRLKKTLCVSYFTD